MVTTMGTAGEHLSHTAVSMIGVLRSIRKRTQGRNVEHVGARGLKLTNATSALNDRSVANDSAVRRIAQKLTIQYAAVFERKVKEIAVLGGGSGFKQDEICLGAR
jgi:hypothetical protein